MFSRQTPYAGNGPAQRVFLGSFVPLLLWTGFLSLMTTTAGSGADLDTARKAFASGQYQQVVEAAQSALKEKEDVADWGVLLTQSLLVQGKYSEALVAVTNALALEPRSVRLRWVARDAYKFNNQEQTAARLAGEVQNLFSTRSWLYREPRELVLLGRVALLSGADPKTVLDRVYDRIKKANPSLEEVYIATGDLALEKHDYALAAKIFQEGLKNIANSADLRYGLARAYAPSDLKQMAAQLEAALTCNSNHVPSLLQATDHQIDAEDYAEAVVLLDRIKAINPWEPDAWAYRAVVHHLKHEPEAETMARETALKFWPSNPHVDYLIGLKLSQKYRFAAGASHQKRALQMDGDYTASKMQLAEDLLRLGEEEEGWRLAHEVQKQDEYDVAANNLTALHDVLAKFTTLTNSHFNLRMDSREAVLYGQRALALLERARTNLCAKYGMELPDRVLIEMFNDEKDFAVRTFGMPENDGFLGVCFGQVITANGPAARKGHHFNWETMLWHEFCHVVTLQLTQNKMPRWLSEGISVYEERQANPAWGEHLNPRYREMILGDDFVPISQLSRAFLAPKTPEHLQFAYYESSLVVQFIVEKFGPEKLRKVLRDLGSDLEIDEALARNTEPTEKLEADFANFAKKVANDMAPAFDWKRPVARNRRAPLPSFMIDERDPDEDQKSEQTTGSKTNYYAFTRQVDQLLQQKKWSEAKPLLEWALNVYPQDVGVDSVYRKLIHVHHSLSDTNAEYRLLKTFAEKDDEALDAYSRLMEIGTATADWGTVLTNAERYLAVDPLAREPYRFLAPAAEATGREEAAIDAYQALLLLEPPNPADVHYRLARLLYERHDPAARRHLLQALEDAPRFKDALNLLKRMNEERRTEVEPTKEREGSASSRSARASGWSGRLSSGDTADYQSVRPRL